MIMGVDPGYERVGYAIISATEQPRVMDIGVIKSSKDDSFPQRLAEIQANFNEILAHHKPTEVGIEKLFFSKNVKTAIDVAQARGVLLACLVSHQVAIYEYAPSEIKKAITGRGQASKEEVGAMVMRLLDLKEMVKQDDAGDALAIAVTHWQRSF